MKVRLRWLLPGLIIIILLATICLLHRSAHKEIFRINSSNSNGNAYANFVLADRTLVSNPTILSTAASALADRTLVSDPSILSTAASALISSKNSDSSSNSNKLMNISEKSPQLLTPYVTSVTSDVHGNLGDPIVVLSENVENWLRDRWQAASNMQGSPIPGDHYLHLFLNQKAIIKHVIIDFETAYSDHYRLIGCVAANDCVIELATSTSRKVIDTSKNHIIHLIETSIESQVTSVKLVIDKPSTRWGTSIWRLQLHGYLVAE